MGSLLGDLPSYNPHNFSQWRPSDSAHRSQLIPLTYHATHDRTMPPADQVISTETTNILLRQFYQKAEQRCRTKRQQPSDLSSEDSKRPRSTSTTYAEDTTDPCFNAKQRSFW